MPMGSWEWSADYEGCEVGVKINAKGKSELYIDGVLVDDTGADTGRAIAPISYLSTESPHTGDIVDIRCRSGLFAPKVKILVNKKQIGGDSFENSPIEEKVDSSHPGVWVPGILSYYGVLLLFGTEIEYQKRLHICGLFWNLGHNWSRIIIHREYDAPEYIGCFVTNP